MMFGRLASQAAAIRSTVSSNAVRFSATRCVQPSSLSMLMQQSRGYKMINPDTSRPVPPNAKQEKLPL